MCNTGPAEGEVFRDLWQEGVCPSVKVVDGPRQVRVAPGEAFAVLLCLNSGSHDPRKDGV